jgi:hypothetical protein
LVLLTTTITRFEKLKRRVEAEEKLYKLKRFIMKDLRDRSQIIDVGLMAGVNVARSAKEFN